MKNKLTLLSVFVCAAIICAVFAPGGSAFAAKQAEYRLPVFETSDTHGYLADVSGEPYQYRLAYISDKVRDARSAGGRYRSETALLLDGGDIYQGNNMSNLLEGQSLSAAYDLMDYDAVALGNHEFDWGIEATVDADGTMPDYNFDGKAHENAIPVVMSNLLQNGKRVSFTKEYVIIEKTAIGADGAEIPVKIAVIGFAENYASSIMQKKFAGLGYSISVDYEAANELAQRLEKEGECDATILLCHAAADETAKGLGSGSAIDLVLGGHTHNSLKGTTDSGLTYMQPASYGRAYSYAELIFTTDSAGKAVFEKIGAAKVVSTTDDVSRLANTPENAGELDSEVTALTDRVIDAISDILEEKMGYINVSAVKNEYIEGSGGKSSTAGNWMASLTARMVDAEVGLQNNGGIRVEFPLKKGEDRRYITAGDVYSMFPFENTIRLFRLTYEEFLQLMEYSVKNDDDGLLLRMSGIDVYYSDSKVNAIEKDGTAIYANGVWKKGWDKKTVTVACNDYIATSEKTIGGMKNPLVEWSGTDRLIASEEIIDVEGAFEILKAEAEENDGLLSIDTKAHFINAGYTGSVTDGETAASGVAGEQSEFSKILMWAAIIVMFAGSAYMVLKRRK